MWKPLAQWLWGNRKPLLISAVAFVLLQFLFNVPLNLTTWLLGIAATLIVGVWWATAFRVNSVRFWLLAGQLVWATAGIVGFVIFSVVGQLEFQITALVAAVVWWWLLALYENYSVAKVWPIKAMPIIDFLDLLAYFFVGAALLMAGDFYSLSASWLLLGFGLQTFFALYLRFWRGDLHGLRKWLHVVVVTLVLEEIVWVSTFWHRGVYLKTFFAAVIFYLLADFVVHYSKGKLTVKVALEYVGLVVAVLVGVLIVDGFLVLR